MAAVWGKNNDSAVHVSFYKSVKEDLFKFICSITILSIWELYFSKSSDSSEDVSIKLIREWELLEELTFCYGVIE